MSSTYRVLCLSHNPAIDASGHSDGYSTLGEALDMFRVDDHAHCDVVVGSYSYPLIYVWCPPGCRPEHNGHGHVEAKKFSESWLNLMFRTWESVCNPAREPRELPDHLIALRAAVMREMRENTCWTADRISRLRNEFRDER